MRVAIVGSRDYHCDNFDEFDDMITKAIKKQFKIKEIKDINIVSGGAAGVDFYAEMYADYYGLEKKIYEADWFTYSSKAGYLRNREIAFYSDFCIAVWDGESKGTRVTIMLAKNYNKPVKIIYYKDGDLK